MLQTNGFEMIFLQSSMTLLFHGVAKLHGISIHKISKIELTLVNMQGSSFLNFPSFPEKKVKKLSFKESRPFGFLAAEQICAVRPCWSHQPLLSSPLCDL